MRQAISIAFSKQLIPQVSACVRRRAVVFSAGSGMIRIQEQYLSSAIPHRLNQFRYEGSGDEEPILAGIGNSISSTQDHFSPDGVVVVVSGVRIQLR